MSDFKDLEFLSDRARELLDRQISSFRANHRKAGTIIAIIAIFVPVFLFIIEKASFLIQIISIIPIIILAYSIILMIEILRSKKLDQGFNEKQFDKLVNEDYEDILLYEIGAKKDSFIGNQAIIEKQNTRFNKGINKTIIAIFLSFAILIGNIFFEQKKENDMTKKENTEKTDKEPNKDKKPDPSKTKSRVIPNVPKEERAPLNEGKDPKNDKSKKSGD